MPSTIADFDFLMGRWRVHHRRLAHRLEGSEDWLTFHGTTVTQKVLDAVGNIDDNLIELPSGSYRALSLRTFDAATRSWSIWWLDGRYPDRLETPVVGGFEDGVGTFFANDTLAGRPIRVRFRWTATDAAAPHWEQAFSADAGVHWETNWTMDFYRSNSDED